MKTFILMFSYIDLVLGGGFNNTLQPGITGLSNVAIYNTQSNTWSSMNQVSLY